MLSSSIWCANRTEWEHSVLFSFVPSPFSETKIHHIKMHHFSTSSCLVYIWNACILVEPNFKLIIVLFIFKMHQRQPMLYFIACSITPIKHYLGVCWQCWWWCTGYKVDELNPESSHLRLQFSRYPGPRSGPAFRGKRWSGSQKPSRFYAHQNVSGSLHHRFGGDTPHAILFTLTGHNPY